MIAEIIPRTFTVEEYHRMAETGILTENDRVELINGEIIRMSPIGNTHAAIVNRINMFLVPLLASRAITQVQNPVRIRNHSEPEPDIAILHPREDFYASTGVTSDDVLLLIEVSDSTLYLDRKVKLPLYASARIPEVWIIDVGRKRLEVYHQPTDEGYQHTEKLSRNDTLSATQLSLTLQVKDLIG